MGKENGGEVGLQGKMKEYESAARI
jgi:hypothetical protein